MSVVSIPLPLPPTGKGVETLFKQLRTVFFPRRDNPLAGSTPVLRQSRQASLSTNCRRNRNFGWFVPTRLCLDLKVRSVTEGAQGVMRRRKTKGRNSSSPSPLKLSLTALISLKLIVDWKTTGDESGTAAPDCDAGYRGPIDFDSCSFIISNLTLLKLDFKNMHLTSKPLHWTTALKSQETLHPLFYKCVRAFCNSFVTSSLCMPSKNVTWQIRSNYTAVPITISTTMYVSYLFTEKNISAFLRLANVTCPILNSRIVLVNLRASRKFI